MYSEYYSTSTQYYRYLHTPSISEKKIQDFVSIVRATCEGDIYGCAVKSALLWYELFTTTLKDMGFELNPYDPCIANCNIEGSECTVAWYIDNNKISHENPDVVTMIIEKIESRFGKMTFTGGKEHVFLGMNVRYTEERTAVITMKEYLREAIEDLGLNITREAATPARRDIFKVLSEKATPLPKRRAETFHSVVAKLRYVVIRARMDILLAVAFLCTRVSKSTVQDEGKLQRLLEDVKGSIDDKYKLGANDLGRMQSWVDASYAVHPDMRSHTARWRDFFRARRACLQVEQVKAKHKKLHRS